jgi:hypothetical protein
VCDLVAGAKGATDRSGACVARRLTTRTRKREGQRSREGRDDTKIRRRDGTKRQGVWRPSARGTRIPAPDRALRQRAKNPLVWFQMGGRLLDLEIR